MAAETEDERGERERRRLLFDGVADLYADLYDATRRGYATEIVDAIASIAGLTAGAAVLEIGCGTGQLTGQLASRGFRLTAIDIGRSMVSTARRKVTDPAVGFGVTSFEDFGAAEWSFDLIVSTTAFHGSTR